jgi:transposase
MPQIQLPIFPEGCIELTSHLAVQVRDGRVTYFYGHMPVFVHEQSDLRTFRMVTSQFIVNGVVKESQVIKAFGLPPITVKRYVKLYRTKGTAGFFEERRHRGPAVLTDDVIERAQGFFDMGMSRSELSVQIGVKANTIAKAIRAGRLRELSVTPHEKKLQTVSSPLVV